MQLDEDSEKETRQEVSEDEEHCNRSRASSRELVSYLIICCLIIKALK
jgi:hypothetical protein